MNELATFEAQTDAEIPLVFATVRAQQDARLLLGENICVETVIERAIKSGDCELFQLGGSVFGGNWEANVWRCRSRLGRRLAWLVTDVIERSGSESHGEN